MKHGEVVHIRVNPDDVMGCIDIVKSANAYTQGMSIAQVVRLALSGLIEAARKHSVIPRREGFEYTAMVQPLQTGRNAKKLQISSIIESAEASRLSADMVVTPVHISLARQDPDNPEMDLLLMRKGRLIVKAQELQFQKDRDALNFTEEQAQELDRLSVEIDLIDKEIQV